jgi:uncharacterized membrane protein YphA (DoxX/SURF4 family)
MVGEVLIGLRWVLGVVFVTAGIRKLRAAQSLERSIASYGLIPTFLHRPTARSLPIVELSLGAACMLGVLPTFAGWMAFMLLLGFACATGWNVARGRRFDCGCGTAHDTPISWGLALRDFGLAAIAATVALGPSGSLAVWRGSSALPHPAQPIPDLIPVPMLVILAIGVTRLLSASPPIWKWPQQPTNPSEDPGARISIVQTNGKLRSSAKAG